MDIDQQVDNSNPRTTSSQDPAAQFGYHSGNTNDLCIANYGHVWYSHLGIRKDAFVMI